MAKTKFCEGISDISDGYMGFIIDQWGVLHDGEDLFPGVVDCMKELKERKKTVLILSNSSERAEDNKAKLKKMGLGPSLYNMIVTPAEVLWEGFSGHKDAPFEKPGKRCYVFGRRGQEDVYRDSGIEFVEDIADADFVLILGMDYPRKMLEHYDPIIRKAIQRRLKAYCQNPDSLSMMGTGLLTGPMLLARRYEDAGGIVHFIGKPHKLIFNYCIQYLQKRDIYPAQTVMLGDTMAHDVVGAHAAGIDTCLFRSGLHAANFAHCKTPKEMNNALKNLMAVYNNVMPIYLAPEFRWGKALPDRKHKKRKQPS
ncbi:MAG: TIGR01459 family HAD-type hydrolase [Micavibrio aeruginosavorus]|uniref:TIGR01459 family HAD-type hydrolase n=1 Tax=Micavibrio aeruginosavorus TaxID=349221 RepID=A0A2W5BUG9_9BACT|nr:MAG: TIGR01459 family HAD-type hydrolase [Micavibrio aeruginosavorus]